MLLLDLFNECWNELGQSWVSHRPLQLVNTGDVDGGVMWSGDPWAGIADAAVAFDEVGNAYLICLLFGVSDRGRSLSLSRNGSLQVHRWRA
jgi:hypothetical protein